MKANRKKRKAGKRSKAQFCFNLVLACFALIVVLIAGVYVGIRRSNVKPVLARSAIKSPETSILSENDDNVQAEIRIRDETIASQAKEIAANDAAIEELRRRQEGDLLQIPLQNSQPAAIASATSTSSGVIIESAVNYDVHAFYYGWYGSPSYDPEKTGWVHWNHPFLEHWDRNVAKQWPQGIHDPDKRDIGSDYWPKLGPYASSDPEVLKNHVQWAARSGIGVLVLSWYPPGKADENGRPSDPMVRPLLDAALTAGLKVALHLEPYRGRNALSVRDDITYAVSQYGDHPALHRMQRHSATPFKGTGAEARSSYLPVFYIYDSYHTAPKEWSKVLAPAGPFSIRRTAADAFVLFLFVEPSHATYASSSIGFDGFYTYFASTNMVYGSNPRHWNHLAQIARDANILFVPSVGPGYVDTSVRPWNGAATRRRGVGGEYYDSMWQAALDATANQWKGGVGHSVVSITSFNEWHEGTQIEPAIPQTRGAVPGGSKLRGSLASSSFSQAPGQPYQDYGTLGPEGYLDLTRKWSRRLADRRPPYKSS